MLANTVDENDGGIFVEGETWFGNEEHWSSLWGFATVFRQTRVRLVTGFIGGIGLEEFSGSGHRRGAIRACCAEFDCPNREKIRIDPGIDARLALYFFPHPIGANYGSV